MEDIISVLVVDDEYIARDWISMVIEKNASAGIKVAGTAVSGKDAGEICSHEAVDIIITDIKMPDMNGLELVKKIKGLYPHIQFIIISNYEDFSYAKQGIQLGVSDYLLKAEITDKDILNCILGLRAEIIQNRTAKGLTETDPQSRQLIQQYCLESIFSREAAPRQKETMFAKLSLDFPEDNLFLLVFSSDHFSGNIDSSDINRVLTIIQNRIWLKMPKSVVFHNKDGNIISIVHTVFNGLKSAFEQLFTVASVLLREIGEYTGLSFSCAVSSHFNSFKEMNSQYYEILKNFDARFYTEGCQVLSDVPVFKAGMTAVSSEHLKHLRILLSRYEYDKAYALLADISEEIKSNHDYIPNEVRRFFCSVCDLFGQVNRNYPQEARENPFGEIYRIPLLRDIISLVKDYCLQAGNPQSSLNNTGNHIDQVVEYMAIHYSDRITLSIAANLAHLSENYFSKLFKKHTGENFSNYLTNLRINAAKIELINTNARIYTIAEDVGFMNVGYFTQVFKKATGYTPEQYRANKISNAGKPHKPEDKCLGPPAESQGPAACFSGADN